MQQKRVRMQVNSREFARKASRNAIILFTLTQRQIMRTPSVPAVRGATPSAAWRQHRTGRW
jgi:hypothetical protein